MSGSSLFAHSLVPSFSCCYAPNFKKMGSILVCACLCVHACIHSFKLWSRNFMYEFLMEMIFSSPEPLGSQGELIVYQSSRRPSVCRRPSSFTMLKDLLQNRWADQSQILYGASLGRGEDILFAASGSHDQDGRHAHIW